MTKEYLSIEEVERLALNSKIALTDTELVQMQAEFAVLDARLDRLNALGLDDVKPTYFGNDVKSVLREDKPQQNQTREELFRNVPEQDATDYIIVPAMIEDEEAGA